MLNWTEQRLDDQLDITAVTFQALGLGIAEGILMKYAGELFLEKKDELAYAMRLMAGRIGEEAKIYQNKRDMLKTKYDAKYSC